VKAVVSDQWSVVRGQWSVIRAAIGLWCVDSGVRVAWAHDRVAPRRSRVRELTGLLVI